MPRKPDDIAQEDWDAVDSPELTAADFAKMKPAKKRGRPRLAHPKDAVKLRIDHDVLEYFKAGGKGWQSRINETLRKAANLNG